MGGQIPRTRRRGHPRQRHAHRAHRRQARHHYDSIGRSVYVQDVIPNPAFTPFLREAESRGLKWQSGMQMLINQAALNITMWTGLKPDKDVMRRAFEEALS